MDAMAVASLNAAGYATACSIATRHGIPFLLLFTSRFSFQSCRMFRHQCARSDSFMKFGDAAEMDFGQAHLQKGAMTAMIFPAMDAPQNARLKSVSPSSPTCRAKIIFNCLHLCISTTKFSAVLIIRWLAQASNAMCRQK
jgi:hypothetical protein